LAGVSGCADSSAAPPCCSASCFDADAAGRIEGRVIWAGEPPCAAPLPYRLPAGLSDEASARLRVNDFVPAIDSNSRGVTDAVVYLRGVDPHAARPWDHPHVAVEQRDLQLHVLQGSRDGRVGFVRRGDGIDMVSREPRFHSLRAQGSAWFTLAFPDADQPLARPLDETGVVELTSGAGYYWMRAYLLIDDHPYYARTDADGHFALPSVPPGQYEIVCWMPNWRETGHDRNPDTGRVTRLSFAPPAAVKQAVELGARQTRDVCFSLSTRDFE
jgi:hypothetical protein